jgi:hypothetical protein
MYHILNEYKNVFCCKKNATNFQNHLNKYFSFAICQNFDENFFKLMF